VDSMRLVDENSGDDNSNGNGDDNTDGRGRSLKGKPTQSRRNECCTGLIWGVERYMQNYLRCKMYQRLLMAER